MKYKRIDGTEHEAEPWSPGPLYNTVWAIDPDDDYGTARVVHATKHIEIEYEQPMPALYLTSAEDRAKAKEIQERAWKTDPFTWNRSYRNKYPDVQRPTEDERRWAAGVQKLENQYREAQKVYQSMHNSSAPISIKRLRELAGI